MKDSELSDGTLKRELHEVLGRAMDRKVPPVIAYSTVLDVMFPLMGAVPPAVAPKLAMLTLGKFRNAVALGKVFTPEQLGVLVSIELLAEFQDQEYWSATPKPIEGFDCGPVTKTALHMVNFANAVISVLGPDAVVGAITFLSEQGWSHPLNISVHPGAERAAVVQTAAKVLDAKAYVMVATAFYVERDGEATPPKGRLEDEPGSESAVFVSWEYERESGAVVMPIVDGKLGPPKVSTGKSEGALASLLPGARGD